MRETLGDTTTRRTAVERLIDALGLETRPGAEVQDLYSRPIGVAVVELRPRREPIGNPRVAA